MKAHKTSLAGLCAFCVREGLIDEKQATQCQIDAKAHKHPVINQLVDLKQINGQQLAKLQSSVFGLPYFDIHSLNMDVADTNALNDAIIARHQVLPLKKRDGTIKLATSDCLNQKALADCRLLTGCHIDLVIVEHSALLEALEKRLDQESASFLNELEADDLDSLDFDIVDETEASFDADEADDAPIVKFINKVILDGINRGASDIHFEPYESRYRIRLRIDGILQEVSAPPHGLSAKLTSRLKIMSRLDIAERRVPQDGRFKMQISPNRAIDFRVSTCPTLFGEKVVLRILDPQSAKIGIDALGYAAEQKEQFLNALSNSQGMILVTGPTGSGKTVSLYTALNILNTDAKNISTAEDPVEINLAGINQVNIHKKAGLGFSEALRSFLRQDPDIIMVGEVRDLETAQIAVKAAQTGHLVLSTLHTNSAPETLVRLANMGVEPYNIATSIILIIAQRLARKLCEHCKTEDPLAREALLQMGVEESHLNDATLFKGNGCDRCHQGYSGRVGIFEVMPISNEIQSLILQGGHAMELAEQAKKEGVWDLSDAAVDKVLAGVTSLEEISRVVRS